MPDMRMYADSFNYYCRLHQSGRNRPFLLMLHGFMGSGEAFDHLIEDLSAFCNPLTLDLAGHGETESSFDPEKYTAERQVRQLVSIIRRLKFDNLYLYGYSMGGRLAFQLLVSFPELFSGVIIESSHCGIESGKEKSKRMKKDEERARKIENNFDGFVDRWMNMPLFRHTPHELQAVYERIMRRQQAGCISASLRGFGAGVMPAVCNQVNKTAVPVTLIAGELDQKYVNHMKEIGNNCDSATVHIIQNAGHRVHTDQPDELIKCLKSAIG